MTTTPGSGPAGRLRVVHVITTLTTGGAERQLELLVGYSRNDSATVALYEAGTVGEAMRARGDRVEVLGMAGWRKVAAVLRLAFVLRRYRPDVVHVHLLSAQLWGLPAARLAGVPVVVSSEHSLMDTTIEGRPLTPLLLRIYLGLERLATHTVAVSDATARRLVARGVAPHRITVVDNGIDVAGLAFDAAARARVRAELAIAPDALVVGAVGRLDPVKRMDEVLAAAAPLLRERDAVLVVAGAGSLLPQLQAQAADLGVSDHVRFVGARADVAGVLSAMDVMLSASRDETFGMAVVEGLLSGLHVAYVQCPALDELGSPVATAHAVPLGRHGGGAAAEPSADEAVAALRAVLHTMVDAVGPHRPPADVALAARYGAADAAARVDALYERLRDGTTA